MIPSGKYGTLMFISCVLVFSHWLDFFLMFKPGILHTAQELAAQAAGGAEMHHGGMVTGFTIPGFPEIGTFIGFLGVFFYFRFRTVGESKPGAEQGSIFIRERYTSYIRLLRELLIE
jgi:hypothetical protein